MNHDKFTCDIELGSFVGGSDIILYAYDAVLKTGSIHYKLHTNLSGCNVLAFGFSSDRTTRFLQGDHNDLISSKDHEIVGFINTKDNRSPSVNRAAVSLFESLFNELSQLQDQLIFESLIITGQALEGYVATLFALWLHHVIDKKESVGSKNTKRPICITFGMPFVGDDNLQKAISERPLWKSCFLNVVSKQDPLPRLLLSSHKPFGNYLICTEFGSYGCFQDHDSISGVLEAIGSSSTNDLQMNDYQNTLYALKNKMFYRGASGLEESSSNPLRVGITLQLIEAGVLNKQVNSSNQLVSKMATKQEELIVKNRNAYEPAKKLNDLKISLTMMEWYKKRERSKGGYYKAHKLEQKTHKEIVSQQEIITHKRKLDKYWSEFVEEKDRMPQKEGSKLRKRWLFGGNTYRMIVEPLDIAEHYKQGKENYVAQRSKHYVLLETWLNEDSENNEPRKRRNKAVSLTEDSCFWARVEEAFIWLRKMDHEDIIDKFNEKMSEFESYVMKAINEYSLSDEIFLEKSVFMDWWLKYSVFRGDEYDSPLAQYMKSGRYLLYK